MKNRYIISAAGSGKTTKIIREALSILDENVLIITYTVKNEAEIRKKIIEKHTCIPPNITIQTWFSFLIQHGAKPFQGIFNDLMFAHQIKGLNLTSRTSGIRYTTKSGIPIPFKESDDFLKHYFDNQGRIYSDKLSKFVIKSNSSSKNSVINRISKIFPNIFIDEVQDLAGYDLEIIKLFFKSTSNVCLVGDPRQVTYLTHLEMKNKKYREGKIEDFLLDKCGELIKDGIDKDSLNKSHRNNNLICEYSSRLYPLLTNIQPCDCCNNICNWHSGVFLVKSRDLIHYLDKYTPVQLRWNRQKEVYLDYSYFNFGESKGLTFDRVLIYPTEDMKLWIINNNYDLKNSTRAKLYVGLTRARYSSAIIFDYEDSKDYEGTIKYTK